jgi:ArsR family transcriptional regulator, arsenate/arsenite/antimonite-responsive transcriptional repressor
MKSLPVLQPLCCGPDLPPMDPDAAEDLAAVFKALSDPTRVAIVSRLASGEQCCVCDLTDAFELSQPTVSHHLKILRDAGLVEAERRGTFAYYWLVPEAIERLSGVFSQPALTPA